MGDFQLGLLTGTVFDHHASGPPLLKPIPLLKIDQFVGKIC